MKYKQNITIRINSKSPVQKYKQLSGEIIRNIRAGRLKIGDKLPSINYICSNYEISRDTVVIAYNELKSRGIISPRHGKGFYISSTSISHDLRVFLLFDVMNGYKEVLYRSLVKSLGKECQVDIFFHYYNLKVFEQLIRDNLGKYGFYVIMPHFNEDVSGIISCIPSDQALIIDKDIYDPGKMYPAVFQNFYKDVQTALSEAISDIRRYSCIKFISNRHFQFIPDGMENGFRLFCRENNLKHFLYDNIRASKPEVSDAYLVVSDQDLIDLLKICRDKKWKPGKDIGIISYDDTPLKEILAGGISVISTDFRAMGKTAAKIILNGTRDKIENPCNYIRRNSL